MKLRTIVLATALLLPASAAGQQAQPDYRRLHLGVDSMSIAIIQNGQVHVVGELWDELTLDSASTPRRFRRVYRTVNQVFGPHLDTTYVLYPGLQPSARRTRAKLYEDSTAAAGGRVRGWIRPASGPMKTIDRVLGAEVIDGAYFDAAVRAAPLVRGFRFSRQGYSATQDSILTLTAEVVGDTAIVERSGRTVQVWVVSMAFGTLPSMLWIAKEERALIRQTIDLGPQVQMLMQR